MTGRIRAKSDLDHREGRLGGGGGGTLPVIPGGGTPLPPPPVFLQKQGGFQGTREDSRGLDLVEEAAAFLRVSRTGRVPSRTCERA